MSKREAKEGRKRQGERKRKKFKKISKLMTFVLAFHNSEAR